MSILTYSPIEIYLNSNYYNYRFNGNDNSNLLFYLKTPISRPNGYFIKMKLSNLTLPISYYLIDTTNNSLIIGTTTYTIPSGNYNTTTFTTALNSLLTSIPIYVSFDESTNKFTFTGLSNFTISSSSTCLDIIGFSTGATSTLNTLTSDLVCDFSGKNNMIYFDVNNLSSFNISSSTGMRTSIIKSIVVDVQQAGVLYYENKTDACVYLQDNTISYLHIRLLEEDMETLLKLNGVTWNATIEMSFVRIPETIVGNDFTNYLVQLRQ